jgi:hypothetical protein
VVVGWAPLGFLRLRTKCGTTPCRIETLGRNFVHIVIVTGIGSGF